MLKRADAIGRGRKARLGSERLNVDASAGLFRTQVSSQCLKAGQECMWRIGWDGTPFDDKRTFSGDDVLGRAALDSANVDGCHWQIEERVGHVGGLRNLGFHQVDESGGE